MPSADFDKLSEQLCAYLDGELGNRERSAVKSLLKKSERARRRLAELEQVSSLIGALPRHAAPASIAEELLIGAERSLLLTDDVVAPPTSGGATWRVGAGLLATAALVTLFVTVMQFGKLPGSDSQELLLAQLPKDALEEVVEPEPREAQSAIELKRLLATATVDQIISAGIEGADLRAHAFANETNQLSVTFASADLRSEAIDHLILGAVARGSSDLAMSAKTVAEGQFHYHGRRGVNFDEPDEEQILVRVRRSTLAEILDELRDAAELPTDVQLGGEEMLALDSRRRSEVLTHPGVGDEWLDADVMALVESDSATAVTEEERVFSIPTSQEILTDFFGVLTMLDDSPEESVVAEEVDIVEVASDDLSKSEASSTTDSEPRTSVRAVPEPASDNNIDEPPPERTSLVERRRKRALRKKPVPETEPPPALDPPMIAPARRASIAGAPETIEAEEPPPAPGDDPFVTLIVRLRLAPASPEVEADSPRTKPNQNENAGSESPNPVR